MRVIIAGSRDFEDYISLLVAIHLAKFEITEVVWGCARGVDTMGKRWADEHGIPDKPFPADWNKWGKSAGPRRNKQMAEYGEALIAIYSKPGGTTGTRNMVKQAKAKGLKVFVYKAAGAR